MSSASRVHGLLADDLPPAVLPAARERDVVRLLGDVCDRERFAESYLGEATYAARHFENPDVPESYDVGGGAIGAAKRAMLHVYISPIDRPWFNLDAVHTFEALGRVSELARLPHIEIADEVRTLADAAEEPGVTRVFTAQALKDYVNVLASHAVFEARMALAQAGLAVERYYVENIRYPVALTSLGALLPKGPPRDPFSGQPLVYQSEGDSFLLYSRGPNMENDGGLDDAVDGDLVWRGGAG